MAEIALPRFDQTGAADDWTSEVDAIDENGATVRVPVAAERPMTLYLDRRELVTLMTLGAHPHWLALGWLRNQRIVASPAEIAAIQFDPQTEAIAITSHSLESTGVALWDAPEAAERIASRLDRRIVTTGCGQGTVYGDLMASIADVRLPDDARLALSTLRRALDEVRRHDTVYKQAGAVHGCALISNRPADAGALRVHVEDVGRHNAVDAIAGWMWANGVDGSDAIFYTTGRLTSEMVVKCVQMGIPFLVSRSGLTRMGWEIAQRAGLTMLGRCINARHLLFSGAHRLVRDLSDDMPSPAAPAWPDR